MKLRTILLSSCLSIGTAALAAPPFPVGGNGTNILHLTVIDDLERTGLDEDAAGDFELMLRQQGGADIQKLEIEVSNLAEEATYRLFVLLRDAMDPVEVLAFDTDADGAAFLKLMRVGHAKAPGPIFPGGGGFPAELDPLVDVLALEIRDGMDQTVLETDLSDPHKLHYLVKRALDNDGVDDDAAGWLFLKGSANKTLFRLAAVNLDENADYTLAINGDALETFSSNGNGRLQIKGLPDGAPDALAIELVELRDADGVSVLSTELP
jgi:hypothetical protein